MEHLSKENILKRAEKTRKEDVERLISKERKFKKKSWGLFDRLKEEVSKAVMFFYMVKDYALGKYRKLPWKIVSAAAFASIYFLTPFDILPDFIPIIGMTDDAFVITVVWELVKMDVEEYAHWKIDQDPDEMFKKVYKVVFGG